jgi:N-acyl homoserine lactone hydrolase
VKVKAILAATALAFAAGAAQAQDIKLYAFSSGALTIGKGILQNLAPVDPPIQVPVGFYVIKHPKGVVVFDTGNNDKIITDLKGHWGPHAGMNPVHTPDVAIDAQLAKIDVKLDDVRYVVASHMHLDHGGNLTKFTKSALVIQLDELRNAFWPEPNTAGPYVPADFYPLRNETGKSTAAKYNIIELKGDMDLFGDGTVVVKRWVGHTPGSQMAVVRLKNTGAVVLTGDNVYFKENVTKNLPPNIVLAYDPAGIMRAYDFIRQLMASEKADFFTAHDPDAFKAMKKAPEFYD